jgi:hypothetical protein
MSGSTGSQRASRSRNTPNSPGASTRGARSSIRVVADPVGARPSNNIFGALVEDGAGDRAEDTCTYFVLVVGPFANLSEDFVVLCDSLEELVPLKRLTAGTSARSMRWQ